MISTMISLAGVLVLLGMPIQSQVEVVQDEPLLAQPARSGVPVRLRTVDAQGRRLANCQVQFVKAEDKKEGGRKEGDTHRSLLFFVPRETHRAFGRERPFASYVSRPTSHGDVVASATVATASRLSEQSMGVHSVKRRCDALHSIEYRVPGLWGYIS